MRRLRNRSAFAEALEGSPKEASNLSRPCSYAWPGGLTAGSSSNSSTCAPTGRATNSWPHARPTSRHAEPRGDAAIRLPAGIWLR